MAAQVPAAAVHANLTDVPPSIPIDAVLIASPPESHYAMALRSLERGAHLLIEKPMTPRLAESEALLRLARAHGRQIWIGFNRRFRPSYDALRTTLAQHSLERVVAIRYDLRSDIRDWHAISGYLGTDLRGGGVLDDLGSHQLDLIPWLLDRPVEAVSATPASDPPQMARIIRLRFTTGPEVRCEVSHAGPAVDRLEIEFERGTWLATRGGIRATGPLPLALGRQIAGWRDNAASVVRRLTGQPSVTIECFRRQLVEWARAIDIGHSTTAADGLAGARCVSLVEACRESLAQDGQWITPRQPMEGPSQ